MHRRIRPTTLARARAEGKAIGRPASLTPEQRREAERLLRDGRSAAAVARARAIVDAFAAHPGAGALQVDGRMVDAPHLKQARRILSLAAT